MAVQGYQEIIEIPTYILGPEDPNPPFHRQGYWDIYPYTLMDDIGERVRPVKYSALVLENEYVKLIVLPELGGRLYSAQDKFTGREIFYRNNVVKPGLVAQRGAWISGGIEFNFPKGHSVSTVSRIDCRLVKEKDGSAVVWIGDVEKRFRMSWAVGIRLRPASCLIETEIRLENNTALPHPYYFWANAAVPARFGMRMIYPCTKVFTWGKFYNWPTHEGRDMATYDAYQYSCDIFAMNGWEDFFGVYYPEDDFGVVHVASVHDSFGKKMFTWGTSEEGRSWSETLSDGDGPYCEIQSGRFVDQSTYRMFPPHHTLQWTEYWYAVKGAGTFAWANAEAAVRLEVSDNTAVCGMLATRPINGARLHLLDGAQTVYEHIANLAPDAPLCLHVPKSSAWNRPLVLSVLDAGGAELIRYQEAQAPRTIPLLEKPKPSNPPTAEDLLLQAVHAEEYNDLAKAQEFYQQTLAQDPACVDAKFALGRIKINSQPKTAVELLSQALALMPERADIAYYLGVARSLSGDPAGAEPILWQAVSDPAFAYAARIELCRIAMMQANWSLTIDILSHADVSCPNNIYVHCLLAAALRHNGQPEASLAHIKSIAQIDVIGRLVLTETYFSAQAAGKKHMAAQALSTLVKMLPAEADPWLDLAMEYFSMGMKNEACELLYLGMKKVKAAQNNPLAHYSLAAWESSSKIACEHRSLAKTLSPKYIFPYHREFESILRATLEADPNDGHAFYYLGLLLYSQGRREEGMAAWEKAVEAGMTDFYILFRNLALASRQVKGDLEAAESWLKHAVDFHPDDVRVYLELNEVFLSRHTSPEIRLATLDGAPKNVQRRSSVAAAQIDACIDLGGWDRALEELRIHTFHRWEGEFNMRSVWVNVNLGRGATRFDRGDFAGALDDCKNTLEYPKNLRIGRRAFQLDGRSHWCIAACYEAMGDSESAGEHWKNAAAELPPLNTDSIYFYGINISDLIVYHALALKKLGQKEEADKELTELCARLQKESASSNNIPKLFFLGLALKASGKREEAEKVLRQSLTLYPWQPRAARLLTSDIIF